MLSLVLVLIYILSIIAVIFIERKNPTEALFWVFVMVCLPYLGTILYLVFGNTVIIKITSYFRKRRLKIMEAKYNLPRVIRSCDYLSQEDIEVIKFNSVYNNSEVTSLETSEIFTNGKEHYTKLFEDISNAKQSIYIEFYTIHNDFVGSEFVKALTTKAKEGVIVYVLCDFIANISTTPKFFKPLKEAGGKVIRIKPYLTHYRSHRKIVVIDGEVSYIGGMNIGKQYANFSEKKNPWRDTQVRLTGECCDILREYFLTDWICAVRKKDISFYLDKIRAESKPSHKKTDSLCQFIVGGVDNSRESMKMVYLSMIRCAKKSIRIQSPYFIPDASILDSLKVAIASGVKVELMIPGVKASFFLEPVTNYYCGQLLDYGATVYKYNGYVHAKTLTIDDEVTAIGSVNMDIRSLMVDDEICGIFYHNDFVNEYSHIFTEDIENCRQYTLEEYNSRTFWDRIREGFFLLFAPLM